MSVKKFHFKAEANKTIFESIGSDIMIIRVLLISFSFGQNNFAGVKVLGFPLYKNEFIHQNTWLFIY
jgi:hypothetical protein